MFGRRAAAEPAEVVVSKSQLLDGDPAVAWRWVMGADAELAHPDMLTTIPVPGVPNTAITLSRYHRGGCYCSVIVSNLSEDPVVAVSRDETWQITRTVWLETGACGTRLHLELRLPASAVVRTSSWSTLNDRSAALLQLEAYATPWLAGVNRISTGTVPLPSQRLDEATSRAVRVNDRCRPVTARRVVSADPATVWQLLTPGLFATSTRVLRSWRIPAGELTIGSLRAVVAEEHGRHLGAVDELVAVVPDVSYTTRSLVYATAPERTVVLATTPAGTEVTVTAQAFAERDLWASRLDKQLDALQQRADAS
jgi:hypothetical protein